MYAGFEKLSLCRCCGFDCSHPVSRTAANNLPVCLSVWFLISAFVQQTTDRQRTAAAVRRFSGIDDDYRQPYYRLACTHGSSLLFSRSYVHEPKAPAGGVRLECGNHRKTRHEQRRSACLSVDRYRAGRFRQRWTIPHLLCPDWCCCCTARRPPVPWHDPQTDC